MVDFNKPVSLESKFGATYISRATGYTLAGDIQKIEKDLQMADKLSPGNKYALNQIRKLAKIVKKQQDSQ